MKKKFLTMVLTMAVAVSSFNLCTEVQAANGEVNIVEQTEIAQGTKMFQQAGDSFTVSQSAGKTETFKIWCNKSGKYTLRYDNHIEKRAIVTIRVEEQTNYGYGLVKQLWIQPYGGNTGSSVDYNEANVPLQLKAGKTYNVTVKKADASWDAEHTAVKKLKYTLSLEKQPTVKSVYVDNDAYVVEAGGHNWWGLDGWAFVVTYSDGSVQHLFGPRGYYVDMSAKDPYLPYDDYGNSFTFKLKNNNQAANFYNMVEGSYPVTITVSSGKVFSDVLKIQNSSYQVKYSVGDTFWDGEYKYKITKNSEVAFTGIKSSSIENVVIPNSIKIGQKTYKVTSISKKALNKSKVKNVTVGSNVKTIGASAFENSAKLSKVTLGSGVTKIDNYAFKNCKKLALITIKSKKLKSVGKNSFKNIKSTARIKVPASKLTAYQKLLANKGQGSKVKISK